MKKYNDNYNTVDGIMDLLTAKRTQPDLQNAGLEKPTELTEAEVCDLEARLQPSYDQAEAALLDSLLYGTSYLKIVEKDGKIEFEQLSFFDLTDQGT